jgi:hypothetical protein
MTSTFNFFKKFLLFPLLIIVTVTFLFFNGNAFKEKNTNKDNILTTDIFNLSSTPQIEPIRINFQDSNTQAPPGWLKDTGEPFSEHPGVYEGVGLTFGWKRPRKDRTGGCVAVNLCAYAG